MRTIDVRDTETFPEDDQSSWIWYVDRETGNHVSPQKIKGIDMYARPLRLSVEGALWLPCDANGWISIADGMPTISQTYLYATDDDWGAAEFYAKRWFDGNEYVFPTHWQPAPAAPTGQEGEQR